MKYKATFQVTLGTERGSFGGNKEVIFDAKGKEDANREAGLVAKRESGMCSHPERGTLTNSIYNLISVRPLRQKKKNK